MPNLPSRSSLDGSGETFSREVLGATARREFLRTVGGGVGALACEWLLSRETRGAEGRAKGPFEAPRAKQVIEIVLTGGASQCDLFDYKPLLEERHGQEWPPGKNMKLFESLPGQVLASPWKFRQYGESGRWVSDLAAPLGECVDDISFVYSMTSKTNVHAPGMSLQATGFLLPGAPSAGAWISYALGELSSDWPAFVVLPDPAGLPTGGANNWGAGCLSSRHQGLVVRPGGARPIHDLLPPAERPFDPVREGAVRGTLRELNELHRRGRERDTRLEARMAAYELAGRLQASAQPLLDLSTEPRHIQELYGLDRPELAGFGRNCLAARRMIERGVRFVQIWSGAAVQAGDWDSHRDLKREHAKLGPPMAHGTAALLKDLKQRGLLDETVVLWTTEFGRMPCSQGSEGRDHNPEGYTCWLAGGGIRPGGAVGSTDEWSYRAVEDLVTGYDLHATLLHLLGLDHERLTVRHNGADRRLTDVHGEVIDALLA